MARACCFPGLPVAGQRRSLLVLRKNNPLALQEKPIKWLCLQCQHEFPEAGDDIGGNIYAVYSGAGSSVKVSGLGSTNSSYSAAVLFLRGSGGSIVYGSSPATNFITGSGIPLGINFTLTPASGLPVGGVAVRC